MVLNTSSVCLCVGLHGTCFLTFEFRARPPPRRACSGLMERIFTMPTALDPPWDSYDNLTLLAIKTVENVNCDLTAIPGSWSCGTNEGVGDPSSVPSSFAAEVRGGVRHAACWRFPPSPATSLHTHFRACPRLTC